MLEMRERLLLVTIAILVVFAVASQIRGIERRLGELEEWRSR